MIVESFCYDCAHLIIPCIKYMYIVNRFHSYAWCVLNCTLIMCMILEFLSVIKLCAFIVYRINYAWSSTSVNEIAVHLCTGVVRVAFQGELCVVTI